MEETGLNNERLAEKLCKAIEKIGKDPEKLEYLRFYLEHHFKAWFEKWITSPEMLVAEFHYFAQHKTDE